MTQVLCCLFVIEDEFDFIEVGSESASSLGNIDVAVELCEYWI
jgi:hypothetical protein